MGDMAVSNSIGSNVFDILVGLGLPWALQTLAINYGSDVSRTLQTASCQGHTGTGIILRASSNSLFNFI